MPYTPRNVSGRMVGSGTPKVRRLFFELSGTLFFFKITAINSFFQLSRTPPGAFKDIGNFDFFNYAGILRSVHLVKLPATHISDISIIAEHLGKFPK